MHKLVAVSLVLLSLAVGCTQDDQRPPIGDPTPRPEETAPEQVTLGGIHEHLEALAEIAIENDGTRAAGTSGYEASTRYVAGRLEDAGYDVELQSFTIPAFEQLEPSVLAAKGVRPFRDGRDIKAMLYSGAGEVTAPLSVQSFDPEAVDRDGEGCEGLPNFPAGAVALLRPGPCYFRDLVTNASDAGAVAVIISFPEYDKGHVLRPTLITPSGIDVPVLAATDDVGRKLFAAGEGTSVRLATDVASRDAEVANVIAEGTTGADDEVIMVGGHLDSVVDGPGINDNGSGVSTILEVAEEFAGLDLERRLRFGFWAGEELGLLGSTHYVDSLGDATDDIAAYLNFDMLASPNYIHYIYADQGPEGGEAITEAFEAYFEAAGAPFEPIDLEGRSDHGPFLSAGIPVGGLYSGADDVKTEAQEKEFGGTAGVQADPCYHLACDGIENIDDGSLEVMAAAIAEIVLDFAGSRTLLK
jgi:Zn-dependent M28 family amino/carboxypeptidase